MSNRRIIGVLLCGASLIAAACGSSKSSTATTTATTVAAGAGGSTTTAGGSGATTSAASSASSSPSTSTASDGSTIKLGYLGPQSGVLQSTFAPQLDGVQAYVKYWNDQGGLNGHKLDLSVYDTQSNSSAVLASAR